VHLRARLFSRPDSVVSAAWQISREELTLSPASIRSKIWFLCRIENAALGFSEDLEFR
jgi:hypothetical protein